MPYTQVSNLDYNDIKIALKEYLRSQSDFTDYDFEGSVWSTLLDVLAYNTYYTAFNTNLVVNELFLDSATLRDNVVAIAKQLGYTPKSVTSPVAYINFDVNFTNTTPDVAILRTGSAFTTIFDSELYQYTTLDDISAPVENGVASFRQVPIYEGSLIKNSYTVNTSLKSQRFLIQNQGVDTTKIKVKVYPSQNSSAFDIYDKANNILDLSANTNAYFLNEIEDENYELFFGDGVIGKKLESGQFIEVTYLVTNGPSTNGAKTFVFNGIIDDKNNSTYPLTVTVTNVTPSSGGEEIESIEKIKYNAPKYFGTQDRAVTAQDYAAIVRNIYPAIADIITYGGEMEEPPEYGKVKIVIKPSNTDLLSSFTKQEIVEKLKGYMVASVTPEVIDPSILYIELTSNIFYNSSITNLPAAEIVKKVSTAVSEYSIKSNTEKFNGKFRFSKFSSVIDDSDRSINSNTTKVVMRKDFYPAINSTFFYEICFKNPLKVDCDNSVISSSGFVVTEFPNYTSYIEDRAGKIVLYRIDAVTGDKIVLNDSLGDINYEKGEVRLYDLTIIKGSFIDNKIEIRGIPLNNDINAARELYLDVDIQKSKFTAYPE